VRPDRVVFAALLAAAVAVAAVLGASGGQASKPPPSARSVSWRGLVGGSRPQVALGQRMIVVLHAPSLADRVYAAGGHASDVDERRFTQAALEAQQRFLLRLATRGVFVKPVMRYTRVLNAFSAFLDPSVASLLERLPEVAGVYRVRAAFPAGLSSSPVPDVVRAARLNTIGSAPLGLDGQGVEIALLDTGVDFHAPYLHDHVLPGIDVAGSGYDARPQSSPGGSPERHGTEMAGILVGSGRVGLTGVVPAATVLPIRVGGWQRDAAGRWSIHMRSDQILAGLERAVDPDGNGDAHDAARIALVPLGEPFAGFEDDPIARAAAGAAELDTLVVAPAGNDGPAGPAFGSLSGPGGAPAALTVGAADLRPSVVTSRVLVRSGLHVLLDRDLPLLGSVEPVPIGSLRLVVATGRITADRLFDRGGKSIVAGAAVLVPAGASPVTVATEAARAGASLVLVAGDDLPAGSLALEKELGVPILGVPSSLLGAAREGSLEISVSRAVAAANDQGRRIAAFSSGGLAYGGHPKPDVSGPGVGLVTVDPGVVGNGVSRFVAVNGASAAAAVVAGQAAALVEARPSLDAAELRSALAGTASPLSDQPFGAQGSGLVDVGAAASVEIAATPSSLAFGRSTGPSWSAQRTFTLRNVSTRPLRIYLADSEGGHSGVAVDVEPARMTLAVGESSAVTIGLKTSGPVRGDVALGAVTVAPQGGVSLKVPWAAVLKPVPPGLIGFAKLSSARFKPSDVTPAVLIAQLGEVDERQGRAPSVQPLSHLDIQLWTKAGKNLGLLVRLRDVLPGRYAFGVTGRGPGGKVLPHGSYVLRLVAFPSAGGKAVVRSVVFSLD
jgi:minor extracellular serine protease Vpr